MAGNPMDQRIESFLADVLALAGEEPDVVRDEVRVALGDYQAIFRAQETSKRMRDNAARVSRALCRTRVAEELQRHGSLRRTPRGRAPHALALFLLAAAYR